jgi:hypothetical protein
MQGVEEKGIFALIGEQGITKTVMVLIAMLAMVYFAAFILPSIFSYAASICQAEAPYLPCSNASIFFTNFFGAIVAVSEIFSFKYFMKLPMWKVAITAVGFLLASVFGTLILQKKYEQSTKTQ